jgi:hypothetical protein
MSVIGFCAIGVIFGEACLAFTGGMVLWVGLAVCPILLLISQLIFAKQYQTRLNKTKVADGRNYMLRHREEAQKDSAFMLKKLGRIRAILDAYAVLLWLLAGATAVLGGALYSEKTIIFTPLALYSMGIFWVAYSRIRRYKRIVLDEDTVYLTEEDYPTIHRLARRAAEANGCKGEIVICLISDCNASILKDKDRYVLTVGVVLLHVYSEEELYCTFLHEFAHVSDACLPYMREDRYADWVGVQDPNLFFRGFSVYYVFHYLVFKYAGSVVRETEADRAMVTHGDPRVAVSALLKLWYDEIYQWEKDGKESFSEFEAEEMEPHLLHRRIQMFQSAIAERHRDWNSMAKMEIVANNASHPTLKMRMETLGVDRMELVERACSKDYLAEIERALELLSTQMCEEFKKVYPDLRRERYLLPSERLAAWEAEGKLVLAAQYAQVIEDLRILGRQGEAEAICDRAIEELPEESAAFAHYMKGCARLCRYDPAGMQEIYHAIELNANFLEEGLNMIGSFCCYTGRETELQEYRSRSVELVQKNLDEDSQAGYLTPKDHLTAESMPDGMLEEILAYIHSVDEDIIENIYLVRKTVNENFFTSVFIIHFYGGTDEMRDRIMHKIFLYLDSYPVDWHFSLFDYFEYRAVKVEKIKGSLVYSKKKNKGETVQ